VLGYVILLSGMTLYNELMAPCLAPLDDEDDSGGGGAPAPRGPRASPLAVAGASEPYDMARSLRISRAQLSPHSMGSMGGVTGVLPSPPLSDAWGSPLSPSPLTPRVSGAPRRIGESGSARPFSLYDVFYSGMDPSRVSPAARSAQTAPRPPLPPPPAKPDATPEFSFRAAPSGGHPPAPQFGMLSTMREQLAAEPRYAPSPVPTVDELCDSRPTPSIDNLENTLSGDESGDDVFGTFSQGSSALGSSDGGRPL